MAEERQHEYRVKFIGRGESAAQWALQSPGSQGRWGHCRFLFDLAERDYDWLVVIDEVSRNLPGQAEPLACSRENTILVTSEPSSISRYGKAFAAQFGHVLTSQEPRALPHAKAIRSHTGNLWFYGKTYDELVAMEPPRKTAAISTVCSSKRQNHTVHSLRYDFTQWLKARLPELEIYGHGVRYVEKKYESLDPYRFHIAIENHIAVHHWTEKLADPFLGYAVPIYCGCTNVFDYFPKDSLVQIDINDFEGALRTIQQVLNSEGEYERRLDAVKEARRRVLNEYNLLEMLDRLITTADRTERQPAEGGTIYGRRVMRRRNPADLASFLLWRSRNALQPVFSKLKKNRR